MWCDENGWNSGEFDADAKSFQQFWMGPFFCLLTIDHRCPARQIGSKTPHLRKTEIYRTIFFLFAEFARSLFHWENLTH